MNTNEETSIFSQTDLISSYSRAQAIADGFLVEAGPMAQEAGWKIPVVLTAAAWTDCVEWTEDDSKRKHCAHDESGRMWDVVWMAMVAARRHIQLCQTNASLDPSRCAMMVYRVSRGGTSTEPECVELKIIIDGGDSGEAVATILEPMED